MRIVHYTTHFEVPAQSCDEVLRCLAENNISAQPLKIPGNFDRKEIVVQGGNITDINKAIEPIKMKEKHRFFDRIRNDPDNIYVFHNVGDVTLMVTSIDVEKQNAVVTLNPNITDFERSSPKPFMGGTLSRQSVGFEANYEPSLWSVNEAYPVTIDGKRFTICAVEIGYSDERDGKLRYCDIEVEAMADVPNVP
jgi:hypothetical protein